MRDPGNEVERTVESRFLKLPKEMKIGSRKNREFEISEVKLQ